MREGNYYVVLPFMAKMGLKGLDKEIYAIVYGFSQGGVGSFDGSLSYLMEWTNATKQGVLKSLRKLVDEGFLEKEEAIVGGKRQIRYKARQVKPESSGVVHQIFPTGKLSSPSEVNSVDRGGKLSSPNNKEIIKKEDRSIDKGSLDPLSRRLLESDYMDERHPDLWDANLFLVTARTHFGKKATKALGYFLDQFRSRKGKDENGFPVIDRWAYLRESIINGLRTQCENDSDKANLEALRRL